MIDWRRARMDRSEVGLYLRGHPVVEAWEQPIQAALARDICRSTNLDVLEIGYGLGMASKEIQRMRPKSHWVVEGHPEVAQAAIIDFSRVLCSSTVLVGLWEEIVPILREEAFDAILYDSYPMDEIPFDGSADSSYTFIKPFVGHARRLLRLGGRFGFLDFSCSLHETKTFSNLVQAGFSSPTITPVPLSPGPSCPYARVGIGHAISLERT